MMRLLAYLWIHTVCTLTAWLLDIVPVLRLRGWLARPAFRRCGRDFQLASGVVLNFPNQIEIGDHVYIARGCWLHAPGGITLEDEVQLGPYVVLVTGDHALRDGSYRFAVGRRAPIHIRRGAWIGAHATLLRGAVIGEAALVAANAVVNSEIPPFTVAGGVPARVLKELRPDFASEEAAGA